MRTQIYIVFEEGTPQEVIDQWVLEHKANAYWTSVPAYVRVLAEEEGWTFPHICTEEVSDD